MSYVLDPMLEKITSPVLLLFPNGTELRYANGSAAAHDTFDRRYAAAEIHAAGDTVEVRLCELEGPSVNWIGEEATDTGGISFF